MRTIESRGMVTPGHQIIISVPEDILPGEHHVVIVMDEGIQSKKLSIQANLPIIDVGPWPNDLSLHREDLYEP